MYLALNNLQRLICHKTQQTKPNQKFHLETETENIIVIDLLITAISGTKKKGQSYSINLFKREWK